MSKKLLYSYGFDIEYVVTRNQGAKRVPVFAHLVVAAPKSAPIPIPNHPQGWIHHWDNTFLEIATPVYTSVIEKKTCINYHVEGLFNAAHQCVDGSMGYQILVSPTMRVTGEDEENHPELLVFGCHPDFNAYTGVENPSPSPELAQGLRTGGGHIHFGFVNPEAHGFDRDNPEHYHALVKCFDVLFGMKMKTEGMLSDERIALYGKAGAFRYKKEYPGVEYRVPSNMWTDLDRSLPELDLSRVCRAWKLFTNPDFNSLAEDAADFINTPSNMCVKESGLIIMSFAEKL